MERAARLRYAGKHDELRAMQTDKARPLLAADAFLADDRFAEAAAGYRAVADDRALPLETRLDAWVGLLCSDPGAAFERGPGTAAELAAKTSVERESLVSWVGRQLWIAVEHEVPPAPGRPRLPRIARPLREAPNWQSGAADMMERLLAADPLACLRSERQKIPDSLRYPIAVSYALAGRPEKAAEALKRPITYQQEPPPGGWTQPGGAPANDANEPRTATSPRAGEYERNAASLVDAIGKCPNAAGLLPALRTAIDAAK